MANEASLRVRTMNPIDMTCTDGTGITKGALLYLLDPLTCSGSFSTQASGAAFAGIAARDKIASDGRTRMAVYRDGIFDINAVAGPAITAGDFVILSGANGIQYAGLSPKPGSVVGVALETTASGTAEVIQVDLGRAN